ncbi:MAG TPA: ATP phosphoribosyltransferase [Lentibacillus sp.]|uniref:ATP phosphoribosyltransferase n=1 Tax=Lentibacillus sp. TaxID=1925746 RepID=UPI002B4B4910|nr:ATP phosphoribosyltransferase [Lentibacillus sp.]HLR60968.1 ATP phosphoribosyltransferase [Lentibacillus sp.]
MDTITLALAKGRTAKDSIKLLEKSGVYFDDFSNESRKLVFYDNTDRVKLIFVKAVDVPTYVENGAADIGIVGKDNIMEAQADIYEILDLKLGQCKFAVAGFNNSQPANGNVLTVASKYPAVAKAHFLKKGVSVEAIKLNGSVELAPIIGLADVIVDIVETGNTIRENGLTILEDLDSISTRLIVNKASFTTKSESVHAFINTIQIGLE